ncbi:MAG: transglutaminase family protein [Ilumatobacteraceae bacterium]
MNTRRYRVVHRTTYRYASPMNDGYTVAHLLPRATPRQRVEDASITVTPRPSELDEHLDPFGNRVTRFGVHHPHDELVVEAVSTVGVDDADPLVDAAPWNDVASRIDGLGGDDALEIGPFRARTRFVELDVVGAQLAEIAYGSFAPRRGIVEAAHDLCHRIFTGFTYDPTSTEISTPLTDVLLSRRGVCQDFAHLATGCLRSIGLAARYVSGYIETEPPAGQARLVGADASHAWCSVWTPSAGWIDFDPTNDHFPTRRHVTVAWGRDYADVTPVRGVVIGPATAQTLDVSVDVARV